MSLFCGNNRNSNVLCGSKNSVKGFTLTEIMVVMVLLSVVTSAVYSFYSIGINTYRNNQGRSETVSAGRFLLKLIEDKIRFKSNDNHNVYMKKGGFASLPAEWQKNIFNNDIAGQNVPLYQALGHKNYPSADINYCTLETFIKKMADLGCTYNDEFYGSYIYEVVKSGSDANNTEYKFRFDRRPARIMAASHLSKLDSVMVSSSVSPATFEINVSGVKDISELCAAGGTGEAEFSVSVRKAGLSDEQLFILFFSFDSFEAPKYTAVGNIDNSALNKSFLTGTDLFCDDGMMFWDEDTSGVMTNHSFYVYTPAADTDALYDADGNKLKQIRYVTAKKNPASNAWEYNDDVIIKNISDIKFTYYDKNLNEIKPGETGWQWQSNNKISSLVIEITTYANGRATSMRLSIDLWIL
ncbi:MAG: prepilin-type N-terminal cleavage/methylation domain-containing protein [Candidatus Wallbacteria bacterium]